MSFSFAMRYLRYKFPHLNNIIEPSIDLNKLNCIWSEEFKSRFVVDDAGNACLPAMYAYRLLSADFLSFVHNYLPWQIDHFEIYPLPPNTNSVIAQEMSGVSRNHVGLYVALGGMSWNIHDPTGFRRRQVMAPDYTNEAWPNFAAFTKPDATVGGPGNWVCSNEMPALETYKDCAFIGNGSIPHSLCTDSSEQSVFLIIAFDAPFESLALNYKQMQGVFSQWAV